MSAGIELHPVREPAPAPDEGPSEPRRSYGRTAVVLAMALSLVLGGWVLSEVQRGRQVRELESQVQLLNTQLAEKDRALAAHQQRIHDVRDQVRTIQELLDSPLPDDG